MDLNKTIKHYKLLTPNKDFRNRIAQSGYSASPLQARLVISWLAHRSRLGLGASTRGICREVGLHPKTVAVALNSLAGLVERRGNEWIAVEPPDGHFVSMRLDDKPDHWADRIAYTMFYLPRRGAKIKYPETSRKFGMNHALIWSYLFRTAKKGLVRGFTFAGAAAMFDIHSKTVASIIDDLVWLKMIDREDLGRCSDITLLSFTEAHLGLFEPKPKQERKKVEPVEKKPRLSLTPYQFRGDRWDACRKLCDGIMSQTLAEDAIRKAQRLGDMPDDFNNQFLQAKDLHDKNIQSGKVGKGNFGKYLNACYDTRITKLEEQERAEEAQRRWEQYVNSPAYKAKQMEVEKAAAADPMHPRHVVSRESLLDRVRFDEAPVRNWTKADKALSGVYRHVMTFVATKKLFVQEEIDLQRELRAKILRRALSTINDYYKSPTLATPEQFQRAIDAAIREVEPHMQPLFTKENPND